VTPEHLRIDLALSLARATASHDSSCPDIGPVCNTSNPPPPQQHHTTLWLTELRALAEYGIASGLALQAVVPLRLIRTDTEFTDLEGRPITLNYESIHHRDETLVGPGDVQVLVHAGRRFFDTDFGLRLGVSAPSGKVHEDPYRLGREGKSHEHIQFGTGTFDPIAGIDVAHGFGSLTLSMFAQAQVPLYEGPQGYRAGARYLFGAAAAHRLGSKDLLFRLGVAGFHERAERWHGDVPTEDGNQGRTDLYAGPGITISLGKDWTISFDVRGRVYGYTKNAQLELPVVVDIGAGTLFHLESGAHVDEGAAGVDAGDVQDTVVRGEAKPLEPVPGKWTVFDFWADWCEACKALERDLRELARQRPDIAVRRVNIVDFDSPIATRELHGVSELPHIRIVDPSGRVVSSESGTPEKLMSELRRYAK
jgi:thiol-disulfide isomerase/thioredoxin